MSEQVLCDRCGQPLLTLTESRVFLQHDELGRVTGMGIAHAPCVEALRQELERGSPRDREAVVLERSAERFLHDEWVRRLRATARTHWASTTRVLAKVRRLSRAERTGVSP